MAFKCVHFHWLRAVNQIEVDKGGVGICGREKRENISGEQTVIEKAY